MRADTTKYSDFVFSVTSEASRDSVAFVNRIEDLSSTTHLNVPLLMTAATGLNGEAGEFSELVKKTMFHGKAWTDETQAHALKELGDVAWYLTNACRAIGVTLDEVLINNVSKLEARYPGGKFDVTASEFRKEGDI